MLLFLFIICRIDDIEDNSNLRRGVPVAHHIFGIPSAINAANYVYFLGLQKTLALNHPDATKVYTGKLLYDTVKVLSLKEKRPKALGLSR